MATNQLSKCTVISKHTHQLVLENENPVICQEGKVLLQEKKTGKLIYINLTKEVAKAFDMHLEDDTQPEFQPDIDNFLNEENYTTDLDESVDSSKLWTTERTIFLIETIETFSNRLDTEVKKHVWEEISKRCIEILGVNISYKQAESKWKSLKRTYKSVLLHNNTSGKHRRHWEFFSKIHAFMHKRPEVTPIATCSSFSGLQSSTTNMNLGLRGALGGGTDQATDTTPPRENEQNSDLDINTPHSTTFSRKRRQRESEVSKRHSEKMARLDRFNDLFEKMIEKM